MRALRLLPLVGVLMVSGCQESLPTWARPEIQLQARVTTEQVVDTTAEEGGPPTIRVDVTNTTGNAGTDQFVLRAPYRVRVSLSLFLERDPSRRLTFTGTTEFSDPSDDLVPSKTVRVELGTLPLQDQDGYPWNWGKTDRAEHVLVLQGTAKIREAGIDMNVPPYRVTVIYAVPGGE